jgi:NADPH-dependent 2,4-dienoyl-CoA reductase/sulfur reductase-like enzyme/rhodanese-related sulfurtransferase
MPSPTKTKTKKTEQSVDNLKVLIIGGGAGGATAAARLRRLNENAEIIIFDSGEYISSASCGLPYYIGGVITDKKQLTVQTPESFKNRFNVAVRVCSVIQKIDRKAKTVEVKDLKTGKHYTESYDKLILSPGAEPFKPQIPGLDSKRVFTLKSIENTYNITNFIESAKPKSAVILGGGAIGVEMAENLHKAGLEVTIVELSNQLVAFLDFDMAQRVHVHLKEKGIKLNFDNGIDSIKESGSSLKINLKTGQISASMLLVSAGVYSNSQLAKVCGLKLNNRGYIITDEFMRTSDKNIYAVGDAVEVADFVTHTPIVAALGGPANKQGRIAADNISGIKQAYTGTQGSAILKAFDLTAAGTGINEKTAKRLKLKYDKSFTLSPSHAGFYPGAKNIMIKTLFDPDTGKILGAQLVGAEGTDKRCDVLATALRFGAVANDLTQLELAYAPPYSSAKDPVNIAGYTLENILAGRVKNFHWHDVSGLNPKKVTLLDVRTKDEFKRGAIPNFINIELDSLRSHLSELDPKKPVYVTCQVGQRGYFACRILTQHGFKCFNLSGGYLLWNTVING